MSLFVSQAIYWMRNSKKKRTGKKRSARRSGIGFLRALSSMRRNRKESGSYASVGISLYKEYRGKGIGTKLMQNMLSLLKRKGYKQDSLSVQKDNYAAKMYQKFGFKIIDENDEEYIMLYKL